MVMQGKCYAHVDKYTSTKLGGRKINRIRKGNKMLGATIHPCADLHL